MLKHKLLSQVGRLTQIAAALANGAVTFIVLKALNGLITDVSLFSQITTVFLLFSNYLTALDLGSHAEFIRLFPRLGPRDLPAALSRLFGFRLICALVALAISLIHGLMAGFSSPVFISFVLQASTLLPLSVLSVWDSYQIARGQLIKAVMLRVARVMASLVFLLYWLFSPDPTLIASYASFALAAWIMVGACVFIHPELRSLRPSRHSSYSGFMKTSILVGAGTIVSLLFHAMAVNQIGETSMAKVNVAIAVVTPLMIIFQTLISLALNHIFHAVSPSAYRVAASKTLLKVTLLSLVTTAVLVLALETGLLAFAFPQSVSFWHIIIYYFGQLAAIYAVPYTAFSIHSGRQMSGIMAYVALGIVGSILLPEAIEAWGDLGYLLFTGAYWLTVIMIFYLLLRFGRPLKGSQF